MVQLVLGMASLPTPDDAADALAIAICIANRVGPVGRRTRAGGAGPGGGRADRARRARPTSGPCARRSPARRRRRPDAAVAVIASVEGRVGAVAFDSLVVEVGGIGYRVFAAPAILSTALPGLDAEALHLPPRPRGPAGAVRLPDRRGPRLLHAAADRDRRRAEGRAGDRRLAPDAGPPARDHGPGPGGPRVDPGHRQEARRADHLRAQGEGRGGRDRGERGRGRGRRRRRGRERGRRRRCRRSATRWPRPARRRGSRSPTRRSAGRSRTASRPRCGASPGTDRDQDRPIRRCLIRVASAANGPSPTA